MAVASDVPLELLQEILEHTRPDAHRALDWVPADCALFAHYALVCRAWAAPAQRAMFRLVAPLTSAPFLHALVARPDLARAVEKLDVELGDSWDLGLLARVVALCPRLRHLALLARYWQNPVVQFSAAELHLLSSNTTPTHLTAKMFTTGSEECLIVPQLLATWPQLAYVDLRGRGPTPTAIPPALRELRLTSSYRFPLARAPALHTLVIDTSQVPLSDFARVLPAVRRLHLSIPSDGLLSVWYKLSLLSDMPALEELVVSTDRLSTALLDALPRTLPHLGLRLRIVLSRAEDLAGLIRERRLERLRILTVYSIDALDDYERGRVQIMRDACADAGVDLRVRRYVRAPFFLAAVCVVTHALHRATCGMCPCFIDDTTDGRGRVFCLCHLLLTGVQALA